MAVVEFTADETSVSLPRVEPKEMISVGVDLATSKTLVRINSSSLGIIQNCMRKAKYALVEGWRAQDESPATLFGRAIHKAMEVYYRGMPDERVLPAFEHLEMISYGHKPPPTNNDLIYRAVQAFVDVASPLSALPATDKRSLQNGVWILYEYFKAYIDDPFVAYVDKEGQPFVEKFFTHRFYEDDDKIIEIFGTVDAVFRNIHTGELYLCDHKTASYLNFGGSSYFDREKPNHQYSMYMLGAREVFGIQTENFIVNVIEVKARPKTKGAKGVSFPRQITKRTEEDFVELEEVIVDAVDRYLNSIYNETWPMGGVDACNLYGACSYKQVCSSPRSIRGTILQNKFTRDGAPNEASRIEAVRES